MLTDEQQRVVESLDKHVLVRAGAGSGKTRVLVERYVQTLLRNTDITPSNLVAVTYTKRAASEMRNRIKSRLDEIIVHTNESATKERLLECRLQVDSALIGTLHSLCDSILRTFPEEAKVDPSFEVIESLDSLQLVEGSVEQALLELSDKNVLVQRLISQHDIGNIIGWITKTVVQRSEFANSCKPLLDPDKDEIRNHAAWVLNKIQELCCANVLTTGRLNSYLEYAARFEGRPLRNDKLKAALTTMLAVRKRLAAATSVAEQFACLKEISQLKFAGGKRSGEDAELEQELRELCKWIKPEVQTIPQLLNALDDESFSLVPALLACHKRALEIYVEKKQNRKALDFHDQIETAHKLLSNATSRARRHFNQHLTAILVDEFQDTNQLQSEIIGYLAGPATRVLLIGDEKQSIYKFQGADLSVFSSWRDSFAAQDKGLPSDGRFRFDWKGDRILETLSLSFRAHPGLTVFLNNVFHHVLNGQGLMRRYHAEYRQLIAAHPGDVEARTHLVYFAMDQQKPQGALSSEGEAVAAWIKEMVQEQAKVATESRNTTRAAEYGDFAVLLPQHSHFQQFEEAFTVFNLPYASMGGKSFLSAQEIFDLENLLAFLWAPLNDQALFGILRSPMFAISDDVLQLLFNFRELVARSGDCSLWKSLVQFSADENSSDEKLLRAVDILESLLDASHRVGISELLRKAVELTQYDVTLLSLPSGKRRSRNVWKFVFMAEEQESLPLPQFLQRVQSARAAKVEERPAPLDAGNSIKLMTIHQAKGLEFPIVVLPCMDTKINPSYGGSDAKLIFHPEYGVAFNCAQGKEKPAYFELCRFLQDELDTAEKRRLFYVAASRAKDHLGVFLQATPTEFDCFQKWLSDALGSHETPLPDSAPRQYELHGAFGAAPYITRFHSQTKPDYSEADGLDGNVAQARTPDDAQASGKESAAQVIVQLQKCLKVVNHKLLAPVPSLPEATPKASDFWLRVTSVRTDDISHELVLGAYFHSVMEYFAATKSKPTASVLQKLAAYVNGRATDADLQAALVHKVENLLSTFYKSELYSIMMNAHKLMYERAYFLFGDKDNDNSHAKRPDLLLQDSDGNWCIVDYKTDAISSDAETLQQEASQHRQQILTYMADIKSICNIDAPGYLYFAQVGELYPVKNLPATNFA